MKLEFIFDNEKPIYKQIVDRLKENIVSGILKPGEKIPSVRDLALTSKVNPNTMQRALQELENEGYIYTERTNGKYVAKDLKLINVKKKQLALYLVNNYFKAMQDLGFNKLEAIEYINKGEE